MSSRLQNVARNAEGGQAMLATVPQVPTWIDENVGYLRDNILPDDDAEAERLAR